MFRETEVLLDPDFDDLANESWLAVVGAEIEATGMYREGICWEPDFDNSGGPTYTFEQRPRQVKIFVQTEEQAELHRQSGIRFQEEEKLAADRRGVERERREQYAIALAARSKEETERALADCLAELEAAYGIADEPTLDGGWLIEAGLWEWRSRILKTIDHHDVVGAGIKIVWLQRPRLTSSVVGVWFIKSAHSFG